jgi:WD40 repeat protein
MDAIRRAHPLSLVLFLALLASSPASAPAGEAGLYDRPVLTVDPGMHTARITSADVSATGAYAVSGSDDKTVRLWDAPTGRLLRTIRLPQGPGHVGKVYAVAISPDGVLVAVGGFTAEPGPPRPIYLFDRDTGTLVQRLEGQISSVAHLAFSPMGRYLAATLLGKGGVRVYDRDADWREVARDGPYGDSSYGAAFAADGRLATTSWDGTLRLYDRAFRRVATAKTTAGTRPHGLAFAPAGDQLAVGYHDRAAVSLVDGHTLTPLPGPDTRGIGNGRLSTVAWSADSATLYAGGMYGRASPNSLVAWSGAGAGPRHELAAGTNTVMSLRPLPDGGLLVGAMGPSGSTGGRSRLSSSVPKGAGGAPRPSGTPHGCEPPMLWMAHLLRHPYHGRMPYSFTREPLTPDEAIKHVWLAIQFPAMAPRTPARVQVIATQGSGLARAPATAG